MAAAKCQSALLISGLAFDVIMKNGVNEKGAILTQLSDFWFQLLQARMPSLHTHLVSLGMPSGVKARLPLGLGVQLDARSMVVKRLKVLPIESIVRGYVAGSAWASYRTNGTVCGITLPTGFRESQKLDRPLWTPSTKAKVGDHDENISPAEGLSRQTEIIPLD